MKIERITNDALQLHNAAIGDLVTLPNEGVCWIVTDMEQAPDNKRVLVNVETGYSSLLTRDTMVCHAPHEPLRLFGINHYPNRTSEG